jgi:hypothetical protein
MCSSTGNGKNTGGVLETEFLLVALDRPRDNIITAAEGDDASQSFAEPSASSVSSVTVRDKMPFVVMVRLDSSMRDPTFLSARTIQLLFWLTAQESSVSTMQDRR